MGCYDRFTVTNLREGLVVAGSVLAFFVVACDGESKTNINDPDDGNGGDSGDTSGGSAGKGGTGAQGGSSGATSGGSTGKGGSAGSGAGTSGSAGASMGGASGSAGTGGGRGYRPPGNQLSGCTRACELEQAAMCPNETTFDKCLEDCHLPLLFEVCSDLWDAVFACVETAETTACDADGEAFIVDCVDEAQPAFECVLMDGITDDLATPCAAYCAAAAAAMCPNGAAAAECEFECQAIASAFPVCAPAYQATLECSADAEQTCDADGQPSAAGCATEAGTFLDCLDADYAWQPGRGIVR
jgi:hypothetical protein